MFKGPMIDELINAVEWAEQQARLAPVATRMPVSCDLPPAFTYVYEFPAQPMMAVGVA